jgi:hypothetical protein
MRVNRCSLEEYNKCFSSYLYWTNLGLVVENVIKCMARSKKIDRQFGLQFDSCKTNSESWLESSFGTRFGVVDFQILFPTWICSCQFYSWHLCLSGCKPQSPLNFGSLS